MPIPSPRMNVRLKSTTIRSSVFTTAACRVPIFASSRNSATVELGEGKRYGGQIFSMKTSCHPTTNITKATTTSRTVVRDCLRARLVRLCDTEIVFASCKFILFPQVLQDGTDGPGERGVFGIPGVLQIDHVLLLYPRGTVREHYHPVSEGGGLPHVVRDEQDGLLRPFVDLLKLKLEVLAGPD